MTTQSQDRLNLIKENNYFRGGGDCFYREANYFRVEVEIKNLVLRL